MSKIEINDEINTATLVNKMPTTGLNVNPFNPNRPNQ